MMIRPATPHDFENIVEGIKHFVSASSYGHHDEVNPEHVTATLDALLMTPDGLVAVLQDDAGQFAGAFIGMAHPHLFSGKRMLGELFIYTTPEARGHGSKLRRYAEEWAHANGCEVFCLSHPGSEAHLAKVYARWGFEPCETSYRKRLV